MATSNATFVAFLLAGSAAIALWLHVRLPRLEATRWQIVLVHIATSVLALNVVVPFGMKAVLVHETPVTVVTAVIGIALPGLTYVLLACVWFLRLAQRAFAGGLR